MTELRVEDSYTTLINSFHVKEGQADALIELLARATEETVRHLPGFVSANLHVSRDGKRVANYAQWRSPEDFQAAMRAPEFQAHMGEAQQLIESFDPVLYELRYTHGA